jgi:hypothetical protein
MGRGHNKKKNEEYEEEEQYGEEEEQCEEEQCEEEQQLEEDVEVEDEQEAEPEQSLDHAEDEGEEEEWDDPTGFVQYEDDGDEDVVYTEHLGEDAKATQSQLSSVLGSLGGLKMYGCQLNGPDKTNMFQSFTESPVLGIRQDALSVNMSSLVYNKDITYPLISDIVPSHLHTDREPEIIKRCRATKEKFTDPEFPPETSLHHSRGFPVDENNEGYKQLFHGSSKRHLWRRQVQNLEQD